MQGRGCRTGFPGRELRLHLVLSRVTEGHQLRGWHDELTCMSETATWPGCGWRRAPFSLAVVDTWAREEGLQCARTMCWMDRRG